MGSNQPLEETTMDKEIHLLGQETLQLEGDYHRLVTFLNQCLKDRDLIFGLTKRDESLVLRIYEVVHQEEE